MKRQARPTVVIVPLVAVLVVVGASWMRATQVKRIARREQPPGVTRGAQAARNRVPGPTGGEEASESDREKSE
jgi:hypothetical protein